MRVVKILLVVLLVAAAPVGVYVTPSQEHGPSYPALWDARVQELVVFVEEERDLAFRHPVHARFLDEKAFEAKVKLSAEERSEARKEAEQALGALRAMGLVSGSPDLLDALDELHGSSIIGFYDPETEELFVQGTELTAGVRATLVHELTHALQDQHFDLVALQDKAPHGAEDALAALYEGDADRVEAAYVARLPDAEQTAVENDDRGEAPLDVPDTLQHMLAFPYVFGPVLLDALVSQGGNPNVDAAFRHPPVAEAQVLDPRSYPTSFTPAEVADPTLPEDAEPVDDPGAFGQFGLFEVIGSRLGYARAWAAVQGWAGDRYQLFTLDGRTCVAVTTRMADAAKATRLEQALQDWSLSTEAAVQRSGTDVAVRACDPGAAARPVTHEPAAFDVLALRASLVHLVMQEGGAGLREAGCVVDTVLRTLGERGVAGLLTDSPDAAQSKRIGQAFATARGECA